MRPVEERLQHLAQLLVLRGVEHERHDDREREPDDKSQNTQKERIPHQIPENIVPEKLFEVLKSDPIPVQDGVARHIVLKCDQKTVDRDICKDEGDDHRRDQKEQIRPVPLEVARKVRLFELRP